MRKIYFILGLVVFVGCVIADEYSCIECKSTAEDRTCIDQPKDDKTCKTKDGNVCVTKKSGGVVERGCSGDIKCKEDEDCLPCMSEKCNKDPIKSKPTLKCYKCDNCAASELKDEQAVTCSNEYPYGKKEQCFSKSTKDGDNVKVQRGCFFDLSAEDQGKCTEENGCKPCEGEKCNKDDPATSKPETPKPETPKPESETTASAAPGQSTPDPSKFQCIVCRSDRVDQKDCASKEFDKTKYNMPCEIQPRNEKEKACYIQTVENTNVVIRDCITTAFALGYDINEEKCKDVAENVKEKPKCKFCNGTLCNTMEPRNSGTSLKVFVSLITFAAVLATKFNY